VKRSLELGHKLRYLNKKIAKLKHSSLLCPTISDEERIVFATMTLRFHQFCMGLAVLLTLTAFAVILAAVKGEPFDPEALERNPHAAVGIVCIILAFIQPIMAFFRPHPGTDNRYLLGFGIGLKF
jgi:hypothetical protein